MYFYISYKILFYFYFIKMCISGNSKYLDEHGGTILLKSPNPSYDTNLKDYLKKDNDLKITQITCEYKNFDFKNIPHFISLQNYYIHINKETGLIIALLKNKNISDNINRKLILYCHENNRDLGEIIPSLIDFTIQFHHDFMTFDYSGYGRSLGKIDKNKFISNSNIIINSIIKYFKYSVENIIVIGREIGAVSALNICRNNLIKCCFLFSPVFMGLIDKKVLNDIIIPVLLIQDSSYNTIYNYKKVSEFCSKLRNIFEWTSKKKTFDKILNEKRSKFINKVRGFIEKIEKKNSKSSLSTSSESDILKDNINKKQLLNEEETDLNCTYSNLVKCKNKEIIIFSDEDENDDY